MICAYHLAPAPDSLLMKAAVSAGVLQSTPVAADMARWDALAAQHRAATPAWAS